MEPIEKSELLTQPFDLPKKIKSQPNLQVILSYGTTIIKHEDEIKNQEVLIDQTNNKSKSQPNLQVTVSMSDVLSFETNSVQDRGTSTSDLEINFGDNFEDDTVSNISSCSAGTDSSCGSSFREDCPHCVIRSKSTDSFTSNSTDYNGDMKEEFV